MLRFISLGLIMGLSVAQEALFGVFTYKCSTALLCVDKSTCDFRGWISSGPVQMSPEEEERRAPLLPCRKNDGSVGACCRDPNYVDDWPNNIGSDVISLPRPAAGGEPGCPARNRVSKFESLSF